MPVGRDGSVEQMKQRVGADEIQIFGIGVVIGNVRRTSRDMGPIQPESCQVHELDLFPETKPVQATFEPVMIDGHKQKQGNKGDECPIAGLIPSRFIEGYRTDRSDDEQDQTPAGDGGTSGGSQGDHAVEFRHQAGQRMDFR